MKLLDKIGSALAFGFFEDFFWAITLHLWTTLVADSGGAVTILDAAGGVANILTGASDNDEAALRTSAEIAKFAVDKPLSAEFRLKYSEANTTGANVLFGLADAIIADTMVDNGAGPKASYSGAVFFKKDGDTVWSVETSIGTTKQTTQLTAANLNNLSRAVQTAPSTSYKKFRIETIVDAITSGKVLYYIDDVLVCRHDGVDMTSATEMMVGIYAKTGTAHALTVNCDYVEFGQER